MSVISFRRVSIYGLHIGVTSDNEGYRLAETKGLKVADAYFCRDGKRPTLNSMALSPFIADFQQPKIRSLD